MLKRAGSESTLPGTKKQADGESVQVDILSLSTFFQEEEDADSNAISMVETRLGRHLDSAELKFVEAQLERLALMQITTTQRSDEEKARLRSLQEKIQNLKTRKFRDPQLLIGKISAKTNTQKKQEKKERMTEEEMRLERERVMVATVSYRAGGLTEERNEDVRAGQRKNKMTSVYKGDTIRNRYS